MMSGVGKAELTAKRYKFLEELEIQDVNPGVFHGEWAGKGNVVTTFNPATNEPIAQVREGTPEEYHLAVRKATAAQRVWKALPAPKRSPSLFF